VSAEYVRNALLPGQSPATVQSLATRFNQKGHERPFQKAIIIDIVDGYMNPGDKIIIRLGDRRFGARGTRAQTFVEENFLMRWYIDPVGTSRFAAIKPDIAIDIHPGLPKKLKVYTPRLVQPGVRFPISAHAEDEWGNATKDLKDIKATVTINHEGRKELELECSQAVPESGWTYTHFSEIALDVPGYYTVTVEFNSEQAVFPLRTSTALTISDVSVVPRPLFADLHVHSDDTVGTGSSSYNFSYARLIAGLDIVGYTANDFNITASKWQVSLSNWRT
jgi:hypothetical protein